MSNGESGNTWVGARTEFEWAVQIRTYVDGEFDRLDDGSKWSHRRGQKYTEVEARREAEQWNRQRSGIARAVRRTVTPWEGQE